MGGMTTPPNPYGPTDPYAAQQPQMSPGDEKTWSILVHLSGILFPLLGALIGYLVLRDRGPFVRAHTATALNFQITFAIALVVGYVTSVILIGVLILIAAYILNIVFPILAAVAVNRGQWYRYPVAFTFVR